MFERRNIPDPIVGNWYRRKDNADEFEVVAVDEDSGSIEVQFFDGDVTEFSLDEWNAFELEIIEAPEDWSGALEPVDDSEDLEPRSQQHLREGFEEEDALLIEEESERDRRSSPRS